MSSLWDENTDRSGHLVPEAFGSSLLCEDEKFHHQKSLAYACTGFLLGGLPNHTTYYDKKNKCERYNTCDTNGKNCIKEDESLIQEHLPRTFSEVQRISLYKDLIESYKYRYF